MEVPFSLSPCRSSYILQDPFFPLCYNLPMKSKFLSNFLDRVSQLIFAKTGWDVAKTGKLVEGSLKYSLEGRMKDGEHQEIGNGRNKGEKQNTPTRIDADAQYEIGRQTRDGKYEAKAEGPYEPLPPCLLQQIYRIYERVEGPLVLIHQDRDDQVACEAPRHPQETGNRLSEQVGPSLNQAKKHPETRRNEGPHDDFENT